MPSKPDLVCCYVQWDKSGKVIRREYRPRDASNEPEPAPSPTPAPEKRIVRRGAVAAVQDDLPFEAPPDIHYCGMMKSV